MYLKKDRNGHPIPVGELGNTQPVSYTDSSVATSSGVGSEVSVVRLVATTDCHVNVGGSPTATTNDPLLPANTVEYIGIKAGQKVAAIRANTSGTLFVTEL